MIIFSKKSDLQGDIENPVLKIKLVFKLFRFYQLLTNRYGRVQDHPNGEENFSVRPLYP